MRSLRSIAPAQLFIAIGHVLFAGLIILAIQHVKARTIHVDSAHQIFKWIQGDGISVEAYRFTAILPQLMVKLFKLLGADLRTLLLIASVAHVLVGYAIFIILAHGLRRPWIAAACALATVLCTRLTFYGIVLEVNYLVSYPFLLAALIDGPLRERASRRSIGWTAFALALVLLVHPVGFLVALFVIAFFYISIPERRRVLLFLLAIAGAWGLLGRMLLPPSGYEQGLYVAASEGAGSLMQGGEQHALDFLFGHTWGYTAHYLTMWVLLALTLGLLARRRAWALFALLVMGFAGYAMLNVITYGKGETAMMMEKNFLPLATLVAIPLMHEVWRLRAPALSLSAIPFALVLFLKFRDISFASRPANERIALLEQVVHRAEEAGERKVAVLHADLDAAGLHIHWALSSETLLLSSLSGPQVSIVAIAIGPEEFASLPQGIKATGWNDDLDPAVLDERYFSLPSGNYHLLSGPYRTAD